MKRINDTLFIILFLTTSTLGFTTETITENSQQYSQGGSVYQIKRQTLSSGGGVITGGSFKVTSSIGQIDAGPKLIGGIFKVRGGFLKENSDLIFKNGFE